MADSVLKALPTICVIGFLIYLLVKYGDVLRTNLALMNLSAIKAFGVELKFAEGSLQHLQKPLAEVAAELNKSGGKKFFLDDEEKDQIFRRAAVVYPLLHDRRILWVDDHPSYNILQRNFLQSLGIRVDCAQDNKTAYDLLELQKLNETPYDLVISDYRRDDEPEDGFKLLENMRKRKFEQQIIYFVGKRRDKPEDAFELTTSSAELLNSVFDVLERSKRRKS